MEVHEGRERSPEKKGQEASRVIGTPKNKLGKQNVGESESRVRRLGNRRSMERNKRENEMVTRFQAARRRAKDEAEEEEERNRA